MELPGVHLVEDLHEDEHLEDQSVMVDLGSWLAREWAQTCRLGHYFVKEVLIEDSLKCFGLPLLDLFVVPELVQGEIGIVLLADHILIVLQARLLVVWHQVAIASELEDGYCQYDELVEGLADDVAPHHRTDDICILLLWEPEEDVVGRWL